MKFKTSCNDTKNKKIRLFMYTFRMSCTLTKEILNSRFQSRWWLTSSRVGQESEGKWDPIPLLGRFFISYLFLHLGFFSVFSATYLRHRLLPYITLNICDNFWLNIISVICRMMDDNEKIHFPLKNRLFKNNFFTLYTTN